MIRSKQFGRALSRTTCFTLVVLSASCSSKYVHEQWAQGKPTRALGVTELRPISHTMLASLKKDFSAEPSGGAPLSIGLALSGGGTRAAMFAHGVMQGLNDSQVLDQVDAISSVSGGSYAALWYYTKRLETRKAGIRDHRVVFTDCIPLWWQDEPRPSSSRKETELLIRAALLQAGQGNEGFKRMYQCKYKMHFTFDDPATGLAYNRDPFRWQTHLGRWPDIFEDSETVATGDRQGAPWWQAVKYGFVVLGEWIKAPFVETSDVAISYQYGIERAWGLNPNPRTSWSQAFSYTNDKGQIHTSEWHLDPDTATWQLLRALHNDKSAARMPLWILNTSLTPSENGRPGDVLYRDQSEIFEITAFGQGSTLTGYLRTDTPVIPDLGTSVRVSGAAVDSVNTFHPPAIRWGATVKNPFRAEPASIRLSDGGHTENLGLYSLLRRGARDVIIVDAEEDVEGRMEGICIARQMLKKEGAEMRFDKALINLDQVCSDWNNGPGKPRHAYNTSAWFNGVVPGEVIWPEGSAMPVSHIWLIKLGWDQAAVRRAFKDGKCETRAYPVSCMLAAYYGSNAGTTVRDDDNLYFPQLPTAGAAFNSSTYLFWAYRELGRTAASALQIKADGTLGLKPGTVIKDQPLLCEKSDLSAVSCTQ
ncbi:patatin-like phospholipase family protein [Pseudomonas alkylphenolica]|uniref:patatin-like phospholipase family protein n=1 Tax=Pseudomonas alkylphenolica TaxID=237609 RepID=UPI0018DF415B|nr:patatin-like phospholipase family protein [Pseudomonas alkylphenolica]